MNMMRLAVSTALLLLSFQAAAADAGLCSEARRNIARLQDNLSRGPTASDRVAFEQALSLNRRMEAVYCGSGPSASGPGGNPRAPDAATLLIPLLGALQSVPLDAAAYLPLPTGSALPSPPTPSGNVTGPMTMQRLPGPARTHVPTTVLEPAARVPTVAATAASESARANRPVAPANRTWKSDEEIARLCAGSGNRSMCDLDEKGARSRDPRYIDWMRGENARQEQNIQDAMRGVDDAVAARQRNSPGQPLGNAGPAPIARLPSIELPAIVPVQPDPAPVAGAPLARSEDMSAIDCAHIAGEYKKVPLRNQWYCEYDPRMLPVAASAPWPSDATAAEQCRAGIEQLRGQTARDAYIDPVYVRMIARKCEQSGVPFDEALYRG